MTTRRRAIVLSSAALAGSLAIVGCSDGGNTGSGASYHLDFGHVHTDDEPFAAGFDQWAEAVSEATDGDLEIEVYPNSALGSEEDVLEQMSLGTSVGWNTDPARLGTYVPEWNTLYVPYLIDGMDDIETLLDSATVDQWIETLDREYGIRVLSYSWVQGYRNVFSTQPATNYQELNSLQVRAAPADMWVAAVNSFATAVDLPYGDIYNSLETGLIDGAEIPYVPAEAMHIAEVTDYIIETQHIYQMNTIVVSSEWFNSLPEDYQQILTEEADAAGLAASAVLDEQNHEVRQSLIDSGMTVVTNDELDLGPFHQAADQVAIDMGIEDSVNLIEEELGR